mgnify:CR=1 FL=1
MREGAPNFFVAKLAAVENARKNPGRPNLLTSYGGRMAHRRGGSNPLARPTTTVHPDRHCGRGRRAAAVEHAERLVAVARASARPARPEELALVRVARLVHLEPLPHTRCAVR